MPPFGFERREYEKQLSHPAEINNQNPAIEVIILANKEGKLTPLSISWNDRTYKIKKILQCTNTMTLKHRTKGLRYQCLIGSKEIYLFYDGMLWYLETK